MGPLIYINGSHAWPDTEDMRTFQCKDLDELERRFTNRGPIVKIPMTLRRGEISMHHCRLVHGSGPNISGQSRLAFALHLQDGPNQYCLRRNEHEIPWHIYLDDLAPQREDGFPDYTDPSIFPALWRQPQ